MGATATLTGRMAWDDSAFKRGLRGTQETAKRTAAIIGKAFAGVGAILAGSAAMRAGGEAIEMFMEQEKAVAAVRAALEASGQEAQENTVRFGKMASALQGMTTFGDEIIMGGQAVATSMGVTADQMEEAIKGAMGLSKAFNMDFNTAVKASAAAIQGKTNLLTRYIPMLSEIEDEGERVAAAQEAMRRGFKLATAEANTQSGKLAQLKNQIGDVKETIGERLMPIQLAWNKVVLSVIESIGKMFSADMWKSRALNVVGVFQSLSADILEALAPVLNLIPGQDQIGTEIAETARKNAEKSFADAAKFSAAYDRSLGKNVGEYAFGQEPKPGNLMEGFIDPGPATAARPERAPVSKVEFSGLDRLAKLQERNNEIIEKATVVRRIR